MKGTEVPEDDLRLAQSFLYQISGVPWPMDDVPITVRREELIRIVAWFGYLRVKGDRSGHLVVHGKQVASPKGLLR